MTKTFKGPDRFREEGEWEQKHPEFKVVQVECHDGKVTVANKEDEETEYE